VALLPANGQVFGVSQHSLVTVYETVQRWAKKYRKTFQVVLEQPDKKAQILIFPTYKSLVKHSAFLQRKRRVVIVLDSPLQLAEITGLRFLDLPSAPGLHHVFQPEALNLAWLQGIIRQAKKPAPLHLSFTAVPLIPQLLASAQQGQFLDKFLTLIYSSTNLNTRNRVRLAVTRYLFQDLSWAELESRFSSTYRRGVGRQYMRTILEYLQSQAGQLLWRACQQVSKSKRRYVPYKEIAVKFGVEPYELRYLQKLHKTCRQDD
jgi:hypothetical protein